MAKITKIKASDPQKPKEEVELKKTEKSEVKESKKIAKKAEQKSEKSTKKSADKKPFFLFRPFIALGRYVRDSWRELRAVRWPSRKSTWGLVLAVFVYSALIMGFILLLDTGLNYLSNLILAK